MKKKKRSSKKNYLLLKTFLDKILEIDVKNA